MSCRQELKYLISGAERELLSARLSAVLMRDPYAMEDGSYTVRTLYFDDLYRTDLLDALSGAPVREKYRLRMYNLDPSFLRLERKTKRYGGGSKPELRLNRTEAVSLIKEDASFLAGRPEPFAAVCLAEARAGSLKPCAVVEYTRTAFCDLSGNVRVTLDRDVRISTRTDAFFDAELTGLPVPESGECVLEVKYDRFLPDHIRRLIGCPGRLGTSFSKYAAGETYFL